MENISLENKLKSTHKDRSVKVSFYITYAFLLTTATVTFIEAMTNKDPGIRHILNLETCISVVAAFFLLFTGCRHLVLLIIATGS